jgi:surface antigen
MLKDDVPLIKKIIIFTIYLTLMLAPAEAKEASQIRTSRWDDGYISYTIEMPREVVGKPYSKVSNYGNGTCVPYARERTGIQIFGWAGSFIERANEYGYKTGNIPEIGAIVVTNEGGGHVAVVEDIKNDLIIISEQNFKGLYVISQREIAYNNPHILGYIYN